jgi:hypothetical protein
VLAPAIGFGAPPAAAPPATTTTPSAGSPHVNPMLAARALYTRGAEHIEKKEWKKAYVLLLEAWTIKQHWQIAMMLGWAEMELGMIRSAIEHLTLAAADRLPKEPPFPEKIAKLLLDAKARQPFVRIQGAPPGAQLTIDGEDAGKAPSTDPVAVDPGKHTITGELGPRRVSQEVNVPVRAPGDGDEPLLVRLVWSAAPGPATPDSPAPAHAPFPILPVALGAGAVVGLVAGAVFFTQADAYGSAADRTLAVYRTLPETDRTPPNKKVVGDMLRTEDALRTGALVSWIGAGALATAAVTLFAVQRRASAKPSNPSSASSGPERRASAEPLALEWAPIATPQGVGVLLQGKF